MRKNKLLILVCTQDNVKIILAQIDNLKNIESVVIVALEYGAQKELDKHQISYCIPEDYTTNETYKDLDKKAMLFAGKWYSFDASVKKSVTYGNINLGEMINFEFTYFFSSIIKYIELIKCIIKKEQPDEIIVVDDNPKVGSVSEAYAENLAVKTAILIGKKKKIPVSIINAPSSDHRLSKSLTFRKVYLSILARTLNFVYLLKSMFYKKIGNQNTILMALPGGHIGSVVKELTKDRVNRIIMYGGDDYNVTWSTIKKNVIYKRLGDYKIKKVEDDVEWKQKLDVLINNQPFKESMVYQDIQIWSLVEERLEYLFLNRFPDLIKNIRIFSYILDKENVDIIVVMVDTLEFEKTLVTVGNQKGVPSLVVQHGVGGLPPGFLPLTASKFAAWGSVCRDWLIKEGTEGDRVVVTGSSRFDTYLQGDKNFVEEKREICQRLHLDMDKKIIVFPTHRTGFEKRTFANIYVSLKEMEVTFHAVINALEEFPEAQLVIKLHPGLSNEDVQRELIKKINENNINIAIIKRIDTQALLRSCDVLITFESTLGLEAMVVGKDVIIMDLSGRKHQQDNYRRLYVEGGAAVGVYKEEDLVPAIRDVLYNAEIRKKLEKMRRKFIYENAFIQDGKASKRVADLIIQMAEESKRQKE